MAKNQRIGWEAIRKGAILAVGVLLMAAAFPLFFIPNHIAPGGVSGLGTILNALTGLPVGALSALMNIPLFAISWKRMGRGFAVKSLVLMLGLSFVIDFLPVGALTADPILAAVFGGAITGIGLGLVIRGGATTGGTDMAAKLVCEKWPVISVGVSLMAIDFLVVMLSGLVFNIQAALYASIAIFVISQVMDRVIEGFESAKAFFVFSREAESLAALVMDKLGRGATLLHSRGAYSREEADVLLCVITRMQIPQFKALVQEVDPTAFLMVTDVREALGEGFTRPPIEEESK